MDQPVRRVFPRWPSFATLLLAALYLTLRWDSIPPRWIVHWGVTGQPNGWATKGVPGVYGPLAIAALAVLALEALAAVRRGRTSATSDEPMRAATSHFLRVVTFGLVLMMAFLAIQLPLGPMMPAGALVAISLVPVGLSLVAGAARLAAALGETRKSGRGATVEGYHALYYANARDSRLWVPKVTGLGWTINFAHRWAWPVFLLLLGLPIALVVVSTATR
jgi:uncharacterized membrane protein